MKLLTIKQAENFVNLAVERLYIYIESNHLDSAVIGVSGGIDSAVMATILRRTDHKLNEDKYEFRGLYYFIDIDSELTDLDKAKELSEMLKLQLKEIDLTDWFSKSPLTTDDRLKYHPRARYALGNIKCRLRMITLYNEAQLHNGIVLDTDDFSEELMGFWTLHGDVGDVKIIQQLTKTEVYDLGEYLGLPKSILSSDPGDGLKVTDTSKAQDQLGLPYIQIEYIMSRFVEAGFDYNGGLYQLDEPKCQKLIKDVANILKTDADKITAVIKQSLRTSFKRKSGNCGIIFLPDRQEFGLPTFGTSEFSQRYYEL